MITWLQDAYNDLIDWLQAILFAIFDFATDLLILALDGFLSAVAFLIESIPVPQFMSDGAGSFLAGIDPAVLYFLSVSGFAPAMSVIGAGYLFRFSRKAVTLFQW
jgi:hypothetical protein